ncbi:MAG: AAA family ATPase [Chloroflexi bacterium]|nr:AAA family ATPase [Chloroflexota bacterium]
MLETRYLCPVMIGRQREVDVLTQLWQLVPSGRGQTVLIAGEAGVGKSRLLAELVEWAGQQDWMVLVGHCFPPDVNFPYAPLLDALRSYFHSLSPREIASCLGPYAPELVKLLPELARVLPDVQPSPPVEPQAEKRRLFESIYSFLAAASTKRPLLLALEDLHWSDETSLELLHLLARRISHNPILLVATYRLDEPVARPGTRWLRQIADLERERLATEVRLDPLPVSDVGVMVQRIFDLERVSPEFTGAIYSRTEGNPFFVEELVKALIESGDVFYAEGAWNRKTLDDLHLPRSVREAILRHLDGLDSLTHQVAATAAVIGRHFDFDLLRAATALPEEELLDAVRSLINQQLISVEERPSDGVVAEYQFRHALTHDAIYGQLLPQEIQSLHRHVAETIEGMYTGALRAYKGSLAYHYYEAGAWAKALNYSWQAGEESMALYAPHSALEHLNRALDAARRLAIIPPLALYRLRGQVYETVGDFNNAQADEETALKMARNSGEKQDEWQLLVDLGFLWSGQDYVHAGEYFQGALELARVMGVGVGDQTVLAHSLNRLGNWLANTGRPAEGLQAHCEALEIYKNQGNKQGTAETFDLMGMASSIYGDIVNGIRYYGEAIAAFRELGDTRNLISSLTSRVAYSSPNLLEASVSALRTREDCAGDSEEALRLARQIGWPAAQAYAEFATGSACGGFGDLGAGYTHAHEALRIATEIGHRQWMAGALKTLGHVYVVMLAPDLAVEHLQQALALSRSVGSKWWTGYSCATLALAYLLKNDLTSAEATLKAAIPRQQQPRDLPERRILWAWGQLALAQGAPQDALLIANRLIESAPGELSQPQHIPTLLKLKGDALIALRRMPEAEAALQEAKRGAFERGARPLLWQIHAAMGHLYTLLERPDEAQREFVTSRDLIQTLADSISDVQLRERFSVAALQQIPSEKVIPSRLAAQHIEKGPCGLTARELDVLRLVAAGKSNRQIAQELSISERTVENHLTAIFGKTGTDNRAGAAAFAIHNNLE